MKLEEVLNDIEIMRLDISETDSETLEAFIPLLIKNSLDETLRIYEEKDRVKVKIKEGTLHYFKETKKLEILLIQRYEIENKTKRERL